LAATRLWKARVAPVVDKLLVLVFGARFAL
jgi:hypothetical protein